MRIVERQPMGYSGSPLCIVNLRTQKLAQGEEDRWGVVFSAGYLPWAVRSTCHSLRVNDPCRISVVARGH